MVDCLALEISPGGPVFKEVISTFRLVIVVYLGLPASAVGICTSAVSIVMFYRDNRTPSTTRRLLIVISIMDILFLTSFVLYLPPILLCGHVCSWREVFSSAAYLIPTFTFVNVFEMLRNWNVVLICVERYIIICYPLKARRWLNLTKINYAVFGCAITAGLLCLPLLGFLVLDFASPRWKRSAHLLSQANAIIDALFLTILPLLILVSCSIPIIQTVKRSEELGIRQTSTHAKGKVTRVLLVVVLTFTVFMLPMIPLSVIKLLNMFHKEDACPTKIALHFAAYLAVFGSLLNSTANFFVYVIYSKRYRKLFLSVVTFRKPRRLSYQDSARQQYTVILKKASNQTTNSLELDLEET